jgi:diguanylate cyclase (GGDEF)-like protein
MLTLSSLAALFFRRSPAAGPQPPPAPPHRDPATGLLDRRGFRIGLVAALREAERAGRRAALLAIKIDRPRENALAEVVRRVKAQCRGGELCGLHASDEIVVLLPDARALEALERATRLVEALRRPPRPQSVSVSIGVADVERAGGWESRALLAAADGALHAARAAGGGRAFVASPPGMVRRACPTPVPTSDSDSEDKPWIG